MKIYTRTGDDGTTGLIGGSRVRKSDRRLDCYGTIDELNAAIGLAAVTAQRDVLSRLTAVQNDLFVIGAHLAMPDPQTSAARSLPVLDDHLVTRLEMEIDSAETQLPALQNFILPGGCETAARLHLARTICRRAERLLVEFAMDRDVNPTALTYLNRLSDWLFVHARLSNRLENVVDVPWLSE